MARIRTIKPDFFRHEELYQAEKESGLPLRLSYIGLWTVADREGRFKWRPREIKLDICPYDDLDFEEVLDALAEYGFVVKYQVEGEYFGFIPTFLKHQVINPREAKSKIPDPKDAQSHTCLHVYTLEESSQVNETNIPDALRETVFNRDGRKCVRCGSVSDLTVDRIFPLSVGGTNLLTNLRTLCSKCKSERPVQRPALDNDLAEDGLTFEDLERTCMSVHARGEGKGREGKGKEDSSSVVSQSSTALAINNSPKVLCRRDELPSDMMQTYHAAKIAFEGSEKAKAIIYQDPGSTARELKSLKLIVRRVHKLCPDAPEPFLAAVMQRYRDLVNGKLKGKVSWTPSGLVTTWVWNLVLEGMQTTPTEAEAAIIESVAGLFARNKS